MSSESATLESCFTVRRPLGIHARPAGKLATTAARFDAQVELGRNGEWVACTSVLSILSLAASEGTVLDVRASGPEAAAALAAVGALIEAVDE